jgi:hypothetical protein
MGTVYLAGTAGPSGVTISLRSSNPSVMTVPAQVTVPSGASTVKFAYASNAVATASSVQVIATTAEGSRYVVLTVVPGT